MIEALLLLFLQNEPTGVIEGQVINRATGAGVRRATVYLNAITGPAGQTAAVTDSSGRFSVRDLRPGQYRISAEHPAFPQSSGPYELRASVDMTVTAGETQRDVTLKLTPGGAVEGKVTDEEGDAMPNCAVSALRFGLVPDGSGLGSRRLVSRGFGSTNDLGIYRIFDLPPGKYYFMARCDTRHQSADADQNEIWLEQFYPGVQSVQGAMPVALAAGADVRAIDFRMRMGRAVTVRGKITAAGKGKSQGFQVTLSRVPREWEDFRGQGAGVNADGSFRIPAVLPGVYRIVVHSYSFDNSLDKEKLFGEAEVIVGDQAPKPVVIDPVVQPAIEGSLEFDGPPETRKLVRIWLQPTGADGCSGGGMAEVDDSGKFTIRNVTPGECVIFASGQQAYLKSAAFGGEPVVNRRLRIRPASAGPLRIVMGSKAGSLEGRVTTPVGGSVFAVVTGENDPQPQVVHVEPHGGFQLLNVAPGAYKVLAFQGGPPLYLSGEFLKAFGNRAATVKVEEGAKATVQVEAIPAREVGEAVEKLE